MVELLMYEYLLEHLPDPESPLVQVPVFMEIPEKPPVKFVVIEKTGSRKSNHVETAMITIQSYAGSMYMAARLNEAVKDAVEKSVETNVISAAKLNSDYNYTNETQKRYRYQAVFEITPL